uniref:Uncharacterized protein n=1 Tax=Morchella brunnea TaxID=1174671 RepID=A0A8K1I831_9PEZI|nr:hypothetical protein LK370_mgp064 [Morchella brunnea]UBU98452.1 hypothetical protein [Morchella brunnea]
MQELGVGIVGYTSEEGGFLEACWHEALSLLNFPAMHSYFCFLSLYSQPAIYQRGCMLAIGLNINAAGGNSWGYSKGHPTWPERLYALHATTSTRPPPHSADYRIPRP